MKCQKCSAENINEAVRCGICGARLKHQTSFNDFTTHSQVQSSVKRTAATTPHRTSNGEKANPEKSNRQTPNSARLHRDRRSSTQQQSPQRSQTALNPVQSIQQKVHNLFNVNSQPQQVESGVEHAPPTAKKSKKWVWIIVAAFMFGPAVIGILVNVIVPEIQYQIRERLRIASEAAASDHATAEESVAEAQAVAVVDNQFEARYFDLQSYQDRFARYYEHQHRFATSLKDIEKFEQTQFSDFVFDQIGVIGDGILVGKFKDSPLSKIYMIPISENHKIQGWECYRIEISDDLMSECELLESDPFAQ